MKNQAPQETVTLDEFAAFDPLIRKLYAITEGFAVNREYISVDCTCFGFGGDTNPTVEIGIYLANTNLGTLKGATAGDVLDQLRSIDPEASRQEKIAKLKAEIAKLEGSAR